MKKVWYILAGVGFILALYVGLYYLTVKKIDTSTLDFVQVDTSVNLKRVQKDGKWALLDKNNRPITDFEYDLIDKFENGKSLIIKNGKYGLINKKVKVVAEPKYDMIFSFINGAASVVVNGKYGFINEEGVEIVVPNYYDYISPFEQSGLARAENYKDKKVVVINKQGKVVKNLK